MLNGENIRGLGSEYMALRKLHGQFHSYNYDSGIIAANASISALPGFPQVSINRIEPYGSDVGNDEFVLSSVQANLSGNIAFASYQKVDLRDMFDNRECMDNIVINVQRHLENPVPTFSANMGKNPLIEQFLIINDDIDTTDGGILRDSLQGEINRIGFDNSVVQGASTLRNTLTQSYESVLYRETRRYTPDASQIYRSITDNGSYVGLTGTIAGQQNNSWLYRYNLESRTVGGYPNLLVGPFLTIIRAWTLYGADRTDMSLNGGGPNDTKATNYEFAEARLQLTTPMLQWNIVGNRRAMTDSEIALEYSNKLING